MNPGWTSACRGRLAHQVVVCALAMIAASAVAAAVEITSGSDASESRKAPYTLETLLSKFARIPGLSADVREERYLAILQEPLVSSGMLYYAPPGRLARHTMTPTVSWLIVTGDRIRFGNDDDRSELVLGTSPVLRTFVEAFRLLLAGDVAGLKKRFEVELQSGSAEEGTESWRVMLLPREDTLKGVIRSLAIAGSGGIVSEISIVETGGDRTIMTFFSVDPDRRFSEEDLTRIFRID